MKKSSKKTEKNKIFTNFFKKETTKKKEVIAFVIVLLIVVVTFLICARETPTVINRGGIVSDYSKYGEYASIMKFADGYEQKVLPILRIVFIILAMVSLAIGIIKATYLKCPGEIKFLFFLRRIITAIYILALPAMFYFLIFSVNGIRVNHCWCGPDYVKIEHK